jgi:hypothetical protein
VKKKDRLATRTAVLGEMDLDIVGLKLGHGLSFRRKVKPAGGILVPRASLRRDAVVRRGPKGRISTSRQDLRENGTHANALDLLMREQGDRYLVSVQRLGS